MVFLLTGILSILAAALGGMPKPLRRRVLMAYLGFPYYDAATLPLHKGEGLNEFDPVKVDRISPEDCNSVRGGGADECLRGTEFYNFGAFFSRAVQVAGKVGRSGTGSIPCRRSSASRTNW